MINKQLKEIDLKNTILIDDVNLELWRERLSAEHAIIKNLSADSVTCKVLVQDTITTNNLSVSAISTENLLADKSVFKTMSSPYAGFVSSDGTVSASWAVSASGNKAALQLSSQINIENEGENELPEVYGRFLAVTVSDDVNLVLSRLQQDGTGQNLSVGPNGFSIVSEKLGPGNVPIEQLSAKISFPDELTGDHVLAVRSDLDSKQDVLPEAFIFALRDISTERSTVFNYPGNVQDRFDWRGELRLSDIREAGIVNGDNTWIRRPISIQVGSAISAIGYEAFKNCPASAISFPSSLKQIGDGAMISADMLRLLVIPKSVDEIGTDVFEFCNNLTVAFEGRTLEEIEKMNYYPWTPGITISALEPISKEQIKSEILELSSRAAGWDAKYQLNEDGVIPLSDIEPGALSDFVKTEQISGFTDDLTQRQFGVRFSDNGGTYVEVPAESEKIDDNTIKRNEAGELYTNAAGISSMLLNNFQQKGDYATEEWVEAKNYLAEDSLAGYATEEWVEAKNYLAEDSLAGYATEEWVEAKNYSNIQVEQKHFGGTHIATITVDGQPTELYAPTAGEPVQPNNPTITIMQGGVSKGSFTLNQTSDQTISLDAAAVPDAYKTYDDTVTALTSESGFKTYAETSAQLSNDGYATQAWVQEQDFGSGGISLSDVQATIFDFGNGDLSAFGWEGVIMYQNLVDVGIKSNQNTVLKHPVSVKIGNRVTNISYNTFWGCNRLSSIIIPNSVSCIGNSSFINCAVLTCIAIPESVTCIKSAAFQNCASLTSMTIPPNVKSIEPLAFSNCDSLSEIKVEGKTQAEAEALLNGAIPAGCQIKTWNFEPMRDYVIKVVEQLPSDPDSNTFYFVTE